VVEAGGFRKDNFLASLGKLEQRVTVLGAPADGTGENVELGRRSFERAHVVAEAPAGHHTAGLSAPCQQANCMQVIT
jgi:hypothetical protein